MTKPSKNLEKTSLDYKETFVKLVEDEVQARFEEYAKSYKIKENAMYSALESLQNSINLMQKEVNYKIGGITSRQKREENKIEVFSNLDEAIRKANEIRANAGLQPLDPKQIESEFGQSQIHL
ncbi:MAG: hypothetical protein ACRD32_04820 [Nitrososphaerales archaeon]